MITTQDIEKFGLLCERLLQLNFHFYSETILRITDEKSDGEKYWFGFECGRLYAAIVSAQESLKRLQFSLETYKCSLPTSGVGDTCSPSIERMYSS